MKNPLALVLSSLLVTHAIKATPPDDFNVQVNKVMHEQSALANNISLNSEWGERSQEGREWFRKPQIFLRYHSTEQEFDSPYRYYGFRGPRLESDELMGGVDFETPVGIRAGLIYSHRFLSTYIGSSVIRTLGYDANAESGGIFLSRQFASGIKVGVSYAFTHHYASGGFRYDTHGASGMVGFARSFGEKTFGRNVFVDTSANCFYQSRGDSFYFVWMGKLGHNLWDRVAVYGAANLYQLIEGYGYSGFPDALATFAVGAETSIEAGAGIQVAAGKGVAFTAEVMVPALDDRPSEYSAFQIRSGVNWQF